MPRTQQWYTAIDAGDTTFTYSRCMCLKVINRWGSDDILIRDLVSKELSLKAAQKYIQKWMNSKPTGSRLCPGQESLL